MITSPPWYAAVPLSVPTVPICRHVGRRHMHLKIKKPPFALVCWAWWYAWLVLRRANGGRNPNWGRAKHKRQHWCSGNCWSGISDGLDHEICNSRWLLLLGSGVSGYHWWYWPSQWLVRTYQPLLTVIICSKPLLWRRAFVHEVYRLKENTDAEHAELWHRTSEHIYPCGRVVFAIHCSLAHVNRYDFTVIAAPCPITHEPGFIDPRMGWQNNLTKSATIAICLIPVSYLQRKPTFYKAKKG